MRNTSLCKDQTVVMMLIAACAHGKVGEPRHAAKHKLHMKKRLLLSTVLLINLIF